MAARGDDMGAPVGRTGTIRGGGGKIRPPPPPPSTPGGGGRRVSGEKIRPASGRRGSRGRDETTPGDVNTDVSSGRGGITASLPTAGAGFVGHTTRPGAEFDADDITETSRVESQYARAADMTRSLSISTAITVL